MKNSINKCSSVIVSIMHNLIIGSKTFTDVGIRDLLVFLLMIPPFLHYYYDTFLWKNKPEYKDMLNYILFKEKRKES